MQRPQPTTSRTRTTTAATTAAAAKSNGGDATTVIPTKTSRLVHRVSPEQLATALGMWNSEKLGPPPDLSKLAAFSQVANSPSKIAVIDVRGSDRAAWGHIPTSINCPVDKIAPSTIRHMCVAAAQCDKTVLVFHCLHSRHRAVFTVEMLARLVSTNGQGCGVPQAPQKAAVTTNDAWNVDAWIAAFGGAPPQQQQQEQVFSSNLVRWPVICLLEGGFRKWVERWAGSAPELCVNTPDAKFVACGSKMSIRGAAAAARGGVSKAVRSTVVATTAASAVVKEG